MRKLHMRKLIDFIKKVIQVYNEHKAGRSAAELAYNLTMSLFPLLYCLNAMLSHMGLTSREIIEWGNGLVPNSALTIFTSYTDYLNIGYDPTMLVGALVMMAMSGSATFRGATEVTREIMGAETRKGGLKRFLLSFVYAVAFLIAVYAAAIIMLTGGVLPEARFILLFFVLLAAVWGIYRVSAPGERHFLGAFLATLALVLTGMIFTITVEASANYPLIYGSIAALIILMVWLSACGNILIIGSVINAAMKMKSSKSTALANK